MNVDTASPEQILKALADLKALAFANNRWLDTSNRYESPNTHNIVYKDLRDNTIIDVELTRYIASSGIPHLFDGWGYFSQSISALLGKNVSAAIHLAYYAELRAGMSLLALFGIGIFHNASVLVNADCHVESPEKDIENSLGTHEAVWEYLKKWTGTSSNHTILEGIYIGGHSILEWLNASGYSTPEITTNEVVKDWLQTWSIDLSYYKKDKDVRGEVSYRPQGLASELYKIQPPADILKFIDQIWSLAKPSTSGGFETLDRVLLRAALVKMHSSRSGQITIGNAYKYRWLIDETMANLGINNIFLRDFLYQYREPTPILELANSPSKNPQTKVVNAQTMLARAFLLLRITSSVWQQSLEKAGIVPDDLMFWWEDVGLYLDFWERPDTPEKCTNLWDDIYPVLEDLEEIYSPVAPTSYKEVANRLGSKIWYLREFQRAGLWSMGF